MTFSIIGIDAKRRMIGSAVASKWTGVGGCVPFFRRDVGMVNMQNHSYAQVSHRILDEMTAEDDLSKCIENALYTDKSRHNRQCIVASLKTRSFEVYSGRRCSPIFHQKIGKNCAAAGNTLANTDVIEAMVDAFDGSNGLPMAERLILALEAGQNAGGDARGQEAAAIKAYKFTYPIQRFYPIDLRVDHSDEPLVELRKLYKIFGENERRIKR